MANGCVFCVVEASGIWMDVFIARGDVFFDSFVPIFMFLCVFLAGRVLALSVGCRPWLLGVDPGLASFGRPLLASGLPLGSLWHPLEHLGTSLGFLCHPLGALWVPFGPKLGASGSRSKK